MSAKLKKIPYPPTPTDVPEGFTDYADSFTKKQNFLLAGLFVFLIFYIAMVIFFAMVGTWCIITVTLWPIVKIPGILMCGIVFLYLVKGFFKRPPMDKGMHLEITEKQHPVLFGFIDKLCEELGRALPNKVYVSPDVNAACMSQTSLINLFVQPKRDLLIGLGLVNCMNLSEFKAVLAHEFGHFCHLGPANSYAFVVKMIIFDLVEGEDWFDRIINWCKQQKNVISIIGIAIGGCLWVGRKILWWILKTIALQDRALSREQEFHADKVAVSAAGSDASTHGLLRARFGMQCFIQAIDDLVAPARDHKIYTNDLYLHQDRAAVVVRREKKEPEMGLPPLLPSPTSGKTTRVFDAEQDELEDQDDTPPMWRTHPSDADREENAKKEFIAAEMDHRSPWILFSDVAGLKERMTYKFYRSEFRITKDSDLTDASKVQEYIDNEHAETTYDPKYHGAYDDRPLEPGNLSELNTIVYDSPWTEERMLKVYDKLYEGCREHAEEHADLHKELQSLNSNVVGKPTSKMKKMISSVEKKLDTNWEWFKSFDRRVYLLHIQMATAVDKELRQELIERYRFQLEVQRFYQEARKNFNDADAYITAYGAASRGEINVPHDFGAQVIAVLRAAWKALKKIIQDAREINLPAMKNFEEGERLADFILEGKMVPEPPLTELKGVWVQKLMNQLQGVKNRCFRLHFKSVGGVLAIQEKIAAAWLAIHRPGVDEAIPVEVIEPDAIPVEVIGADAIPVEIVPAEVMDEVIAAEIIPIDVVGEPSPFDSLPAEPAPPAATTTVPVGTPMAAFLPPQPVPQPQTVQRTPTAILTAVVSPPPVLPPAPPAPSSAESSPSVATVHTQMIPSAVPVTAVSPLPVSSYALPKTPPEVTDSLAATAKSLPAEPEYAAVPPTPPIPEPNIPSAVPITAVSPLPVSSYAAQKSPPVPAPVVSPPPVSTAADSRTAPAMTVESVTPEILVQPAPVVEIPQVSFAFESEAEKPSPAPNPALSSSPAEPGTVMKADSSLESKENNPPSECKLERLADSYEVDRTFSDTAKKSSPDEDDKTEMMEFTDDEKLQLRSIFGETVLDTSANSAEVEAPDLDATPSPTGSEASTPGSAPVKITESTIALDPPAADAISPSATTKTSMPTEEPIPIEEVFSLDADEALPPAKNVKTTPVEEPIPVEEIFSLDADEAAPPAAATLAPQEQTIPVEEVFDLDADEAAPPAAATIHPEEEAIPVEEIFDLDSDQAHAPSAATPPAEDEVLALDEDAIVAEEVIEPVPAKPPAPKAPFGTAAKPASETIAQPLAKPPLSGISTPAGRPAFGSAAPPPTANGSTSKAPSKPKGKRPSVRITMVKPGDKSPFGN